MVFMECSIKSLYLCVNDMDRAIKFYEELFEKKVTTHDDIYSVFDISGFRLGLFNYRKTNEAHTFGNSCLPSIDVSDIDTLKRKLEGKKVVFPLTKIGLNWLAEFCDSEGNHIEITSPIE